ncbi:MAG: 4Fe-4S dicluster domain-containing protein [Puniceicoccaceae bacterium]|nr:MAG: 4Fe-4S dicluster domain-containing protein [Puniceicoccaceae bacterium]
MKRVTKHPDPSPAELSGPRYWRSLDDLMASPGFIEQVEREFPAGASEMSEVDRRHFFKIMAASFALGGLGFAGCRRPEAYIVPYAKAPEYVIPGEPLYYASACEHRGEAIPVLVETHTGRPTKIEGNPSFAPYGGKTDLWTQASVLNLYDPDRSTAHRRGRRTLARSEVNDLLREIGRRHRDNGGRGIAFLAEESSSPTRARLVAELRRRFPEAIWAEYEPLGDSASVEAASALAGRRARPLFRYGRATRILSLDSDFLQTEPGALAATRGFSEGRRVKSAEDSMNRLYAIESVLTVTGANADHRLRLASSQIPVAVAALAARLLGQAPAGLGDLAARVDDLPGVRAWVETCADDLRSAGREALVVAGKSQPAAVHALALLINQTLGAIGHTIELAALPGEAPASLETLAEALRGDSVETLLILGGNPVYNAPGDLNWGELQESAGEVIRLGLYEDETSARANVHLTAAHYLEAWGDARTSDGTVLPVQPMILPLFGGLTELEVLARILGRDVTDPYNLVFETTLGNIGDGATDHDFRRFLHEGFLEGSGYELIRAHLSTTAATELVARLGPPPVPPTASAPEVRFLPDYRVDDGRFANNGWLQECPDPITKMTWDNAIYMSPRLASELKLIAGTPALPIARNRINPVVRGIQQGQIIELTVNGVTLRGPVHIQPGMDNYTLAIPLGYGRARTGRIGTGSGFDAYPARSAETPWVARASALEITRDRFGMANGQEHWSMEGRAIIREANHDKFVANPAFVRDIGMESHTPPNYGADADLPLAVKATTTPRGNSLYEHPQFTGVHQWGMSIDLNTCIGCNACVIACQAENNIPIVGRDQVRRGREMHWIRIDRYYSSGSKDNTYIPEDPQISLQPVACVHCENAPCETVCPVNATVHDEEGLNVMAYNRCVGTRYCANNCPYKVRRFNFFDWHQRQLDKLYLGPAAPKGMPELLQMAQNPDVTVRMRGVMEKCTYCVQRIQAAKIKRKVAAGASDDIKIPDGTFQVACQQACPADAIVFGDITDPESEVSKAKHREHDYSLLGYLNTRPRTTYLGKLRNPNPAMPDYHKLPLSYQEYRNANYPASGNGGSEGGSR